MDRWWQTAVLQRAPGYTPTVGMVLALAGAAGATDLDHRRCQQRGLMDHRREPTDAGRAVIARQFQRLKDHPHG